jgi:hypothetical protein
LPKEELLKKEEGVGDMDEIQLAILESLAISLSQNEVSVPPYLKAIRDAQIAQEEEEFKEAIRRSQLETKTGREDKELQRALTISVSDHNSRRTTSEDQDLQRALMLSLDSQQCGSNKDEELERTLTASLAESQKRAQDENSDLDRAIALSLAEQSYLEQNKGRSTVTFGSGAAKSEFSCPICGGTFNSLLLCNEHLNLHQYY